MNGRDIVIKSHEKGEQLIKTWRDQKELEWQGKKTTFLSDPTAKEKNREEYKTYTRHESFDKYIL